MKHVIGQLIGLSIEGLQQGGTWPSFAVPAIEVTRPKSESFGDATTNVALILAKLVGKSPMMIAEDLKNDLLKRSQEDKDSFIESVTVAAPGYINFAFSQKYFKGTVREILQDKAAFGNTEIGKGIKVNNEFISANPTGPLHLGNGRGGFFGDSLSRVLRKAEFEVANEYYVNDAGEQVVKLGHSVLKDDEAVYGGEYIDDLHVRFGSVGGDVRTVGEQSAEYILEEYIKKTIAQKMQVSFDVWMSEKSLVEDGFVDRAIALLTEKELTFEVDGALWFRSTQFGDDKDRVLVKSNGDRTYFASDCGYILNKMERGFSNLIEIWGADHHGYINRFQAISQALGLSGDVRFLIVQLVKVVKDGKEVRMSKRAGNVVLIDDLIDAVGHDVTRFFFLMYAPNTHMNFDLGLAEERSQKNPVFYVQYAHARISSILEKAKESGFLVEENAIENEGAMHEKEVALIRELSLFPELIEEIAQSYDVHKLPHYAIRLADKFHSFYNDCKVIDEADKEMTASRLRIVAATRIVLAETLRLIGVSAPDKM